MKSKKAKSAIIKKEKKLVSALAQVLNCWK